MEIKKMAYGFVSDGLNLIKETILDDWDIELNEKKEIVKFTEETEIIFYDESKQFDENFLDGSTVKYVLLPIYKDNSYDKKDYTKLLNAGSKVLLNRKKVMDKFSEGLNYFVLDYDPFFGLRLLSFQKYKPHFFNCEERILFETLLIKFHQFKFKGFFYSYNTISNELGIKRDRANTIIRKFIKIGFLSCNVKTSQINKRPSQITYYLINANKVIELIPEIYISDFTKQIEEEITAYLEPAIVKLIDTSYPEDLSTVMQ